MTLITEFDFNLPESLIAKESFFPKERTKMLVYHNAQLLDREVINLIDFLQENDVLVFNDARVIKAKLKAKIQRSGVDVEFNLDQEIKSKTWQALAKKTKRIKEGDILEIASDFFVKVIEKKEDGFILLEFLDDNFLEKIEKYGAIPLPPYIKRSEVKDYNDEKNYQTIYAKSGTAVAAPTAGLHFTDKIFSLLDEKKIKKAFVTLNVGAGTFLPVRSLNIENHKMHEEFFTISKDSAKIINEAKAAGGRIVAVGTTSLRVLESVADENGYVFEAQRKTDIFITPSYKFKAVDVLMTNFHLPKSTLFILICAFVGKKQAFEIYNHAIVKKYRFYSYGDACLLMLDK